MCVWCVWYDAVLYISIDSVAVLSLLCYVLFLLSSNKIILLSVLKKGIHLVDPFFFFFVCAQRVMGNFFKNQGKITQHNR